MVFMMSVKVPKLIFSEKNLLYVSFSVIPWWYELNLDFIMIYAANRELCQDFLLSDSDVYLHSAFISIQLIRWWLHACIFSVWLNILMILSAVLADILWVKWNLSCKWNVDVMIVVIAAVKFIVYNMYYPLDIYISPLRYQHVVHLMIHNVFTSKISCKIWWNGRCVAPLYKAHLMHSTCILY